jgi:hypothetical protein
MYRNDKSLPSLVGQWLDLADSKHRAMDQSRGL